MLNMTHIGQVMNMILDYRSTSYSRYAQTSAIDHGRFIDYYSRKIGTVFVIQKSWNCLDVACGFGNFLAYLNALGVNNFHGVDSSEFADWPGRFSPTFRCCGKTARRSCLAYHPA